MHIMSTNFAKTLIWKHKYDVKVWRHKQGTVNTSDYHVPLNENPSHDYFLRTPLIGTLCNKGKKMSWCHSVVQGFQTQYDEASIWNANTFETSFQKCFELIFKTEALHKIKAFVQAQT